MGVKIVSNVCRGGLKAGQIYEVTANQANALVTEGVAKYWAPPTAASGAATANPVPTQEVPPPPPLDDFSFSTDDLDEHD